MKWHQLDRINLTVVFDEIKTSKISRNYIADKLDEDIDFIDLPGNRFLVKLSDENGFKIQARYDNRRLHIDLSPTQGEDGLLEITCIENWPLEYFSEVSVILSKAVNNAKIVGYGFNIDGVAKFNENVEAGKIFKKLFMKNNSLFENGLKAKVISFSPDFTLNFEGYKIIVNLKAVDAKKVSNFVKAHFNIHYDKEIPEAAEIKAEFYNSYNKSKKVLNLITV
ncbi:hypothetical protein MWH28_08730 [Natroniella sulfidigena]|uniref:hypothetical protein n=1 Tax=Natroniella sulfidigena TaxID=723921 RepID=UPI00200B23C3|nr:hypothetical protein [Natroniella sulfidigena]MCK8817442.1 hypothetical protein [Natroniella sulfidigena]